VLSYKQFRRKSFPIVSDLHFALLQRSDRSGIGEREKKKGSGHWVYTSSPWGLSDLTIVVCFPNTKRNSRVLALGEFLRVVYFHPVDVLNGV